MDLPRLQPKLCRPAGTQDGWYAYRFEATLDATIIKRVPTTSIYCRDTVSRPVYAPALRVELLCTQTQVASIDMKIGLSAGA